MCKLQTGEKMADEATKGASGGAGGAGEGFNLDGILGELGSFGKYQRLLLLLLAFRDSFLHMCNFNYVFTAAEVSYRCAVPECEPLDNRYNASWTSFALGNETNVCHRLSPYTAGPGDLSVLTQQWNATNSTVGKCTPELFGGGRVIPCENIVYEDYNSIVAEFNLGCQPWRRTLIGTVHNLGLVFSFIISGFISDRYGRKVIIVGTPLAVGVAGLLKSFAPGYWALLVLELLETALGYGNASMVLSLETVTQSNRVTYSCIADMMASFGGAFFGLVAWKVPYWRHMMRAIYAPLLVVVFYIFLVDEGVRWLLAHDRRAEAARVLNKVAKINNITLSHQARAMLDTIADDKGKPDGTGPSDSAGTPQILSVLRSRKILKRMALIAASFFCSMFVQSGAIINSAGVSGNKYINFSAMMLVAMPTRAITALTLTRFGRRVPICVAYCLCAVFFITSAFIPKSLGWASLAFYLAAQMCSSYGIFSLHVVAMEVFPTTARNSLTNAANTVGRVGAVLAPQTPLLEKYMSGLPSLVFGVAALGPALLALLLPDTSRTALPDRVADAERIDGPDDADARVAGPGC